VELSKKVPLRQTGIGVQPSACAPSVRIIERHQKTIGTPHGFPFKKKARALVSKRSSYTGAFPRWQCCMQTVSPGCYKKVAVSRRSNQKIELPRVGIKASYYCGQSHRRKLSHWDTFSHIVEPVIRWGYPHHSLPKLNSKKHTLVESCLTLQHEVHSNPEPMR